MAVGRRVRGKGTVTGSGKFAPGSHEEAAVAVAAATVTGGSTRGHTLAADTIMFRSDAARVIDDTGLALGRPTSDTEDLTKSTGRIARGAIGKLFHTARGARPSFP